MTMYLPDFFFSPFLKMQPPGLRISPCVSQCCDLGYHASLHRALRTYLSAEQNVESSKHSGLEMLDGAAESLEANGDKQKLMETYNNVFCPPTRFDFQSHMGDTVGPARHLLSLLLPVWFNGLDEKHGNKNLFFCFAPW